MVPVTMMIPFDEYGRLAATAEARGHPTIADLSLCGYLFWPDQIGMDRADYPNIAAWLARIAALPGYKRPEELMPSGMDPATATA